MKLVQRLGIGFIQTKFKLLGLLSKRMVAKQAFRLFCRPQFKSKRKTQPKHAEPLELLVNDVLIKGHRWNHMPSGPSSQPPVDGQPHKALLLHGFNSAAYKFDSYVPMLVKKGYEVLSFDARAHGDSGGKTTNAVEYSQMIQQVIATYGPINCFIAHSFGGIAISLALEKIKHDAQTKIVLIAPATETTSAIDSAFKLLKIKDTAVRNEFDQLILKMSGHPSAWFSIRRAVNNITAQILWIHDEDDDITPLSDALKVKADHHPNINFIITKGLGHRRIYHDKAVKKAIENFI